MGEDFDERLGMFCFVAYGRFARGRALYIWKRKCTECGSMATMLFSIPQKLEGSLPKI